MHGVLVGEGLCRERGMHAAAEGNLSRGALQHCAWQQPARPNELCNPQQCTSRAAVSLHGASCTHGNLHSLRAPATSTDPHPFRPYDMQACHPFASTHPYMHVYTQVDVDVFRTLAPVRDAPRGGAPSFLNEALAAWRELNRWALARPWSFVLSFLCFYLPWTSPVYRIYIYIYIYIFWAAYPF